MKRYTEKHIILWKDDTWVTCPECQKIAVVTNCQVHCPHCGFEKKAEELELFAAIVKLNCPNCGTLIEHCLPAYARVSFWFLFCSFGLMSFC